MDVFEPCTSCSCDRPDVCLNCGRIMDKDMAHVLALKDDALLHALNVMEDEYSCYQPCSTDCQWCGPLAKALEVMP